MPDHPIEKGLKPIESWDETYVHHKHNNKDRIILEYREDKEGKEPWTWVRTHGKGRVFYSTFGHTEEAWDRKDVQTMYLEAIKWSLKLTEGEPSPHALR